MKWKLVLVAAVAALAFSVATVAHADDLKDQNVGERMHGGAFGGGRGASADLKIKLYLEPDEETVDERDLLECKPLSDPKKVEVAKREMEHDSN